MFASLFLDISILGIVDRLSIMEQWVLALALTHIHLTYTCTSPSL